MTLGAVLIIVASAAFSVGCAVAALYLRHKGKTERFLDTPEDVRGVTEDTFWGHAAAGTILTLSLAFDCSFIATTAVIFLFCWALGGVVVQTIKIGNLHTSCDNCASALGLTRDV